MKLFRGENFDAILIIYFVLALLTPNIILSFTEDYTTWSNFALITLPAGVYLLWSALSKRSGVMILLGFIFIFFSAFQLVLLYLFGGSVIATDMFTNLFTTNPDEAGELLSNIYPAIIGVCILYIPTLWIATRRVIKRRVIAPKIRRRAIATGVILSAIGALSIAPAESKNSHGLVLTDEIFPINALYNLQLSLTELHRSKSFDDSSLNFSYNATRDVDVDKREIYVYIIGEAARAMNWQLYGYSRPTNPKLSKMDNITIFYDVLTQSNTTHKSVPMMLSSTASYEHDELYRRRGIAALFNEAGFVTWHISNHSPQGAMIDNLASDANHIIYEGGKRHDMQLLERMREAIEESQEEKILFVLHTYGSHFSYKERYPSEFAQFTPDDNVRISVDNVDKIRNAYDNSTLYTDHFLAETINYLRSLEDTISALLYCSDHGEDLLDDKRERFLHASPTTTAYQLYVASLSWFSADYRAQFGDKVDAAKLNCDAPATTHAMFHTMADIASIKSQYLKSDVSLVNSEYNRSPQRLYLNDRNRAVPYIETGLKAEDIAVFEQYGIEL